MPFLEAEIRQIGMLVWETVLGTPLVGTPAGASMPGGGVAAAVEFSGAWEGVLTLECGVDCARRVAATMFGRDAAGIGPAEIRDAMGELASMMGGKVKALLPGRCRLSLPISELGATGALPEPRGELVSRVQFESLGMPVLVQLLRWTGGRDAQEGSRGAVPADQRRVFSRVAVELPGVLILDGGAQVAGTMGALSLGGGFFRTAGRVPVGTACEVRLPLEGAEAEVHALGRVVRQGEGGLGIEFRELVGLDSLEHLRSLVRFNTGDPGRVEQEFHEHLGLSRET